jgi:hypothetical protein
MKDKVLHLFIPPQKYVIEGFSAGIQSIASYMKVKHPDLSVRIHDLSHTAKEEVTGYLRTTKIAGSQYLHFAGISTTTATYQAAIDLSRKIKRINKKTIVIMGGHHVNSQEEVILGQHTEVDIIVRGEGELPLAQLVKNYPKLKEVQGITYRVSGQPKHNPAPPLLTGTELDALPFDINEIRLQSPLGKFDHITYVSARGCPLKCHFCAVSNERIRSKSINKVIEDLKYLVLKKGFKKIAIEDNFFARSPKRTIELCNAIVKGHQQNPDFRFTWDCQTRVESVLKPEIVSSMKKAGCEAVYLGVENFDSGLLKYLGKTTDPLKYLENTRRAIDLLTSSGIECYVNLQIGLPDERKEEKQRNLEGIRTLGEIAYKNKKAITVFPMLAVVYPGTYLFNELIEKGVPASVFEDYTPWEEQHEEMQHFLSDHFAHGTGGLPTGLFDNIEQIKNLDFDKALSKAFRIVRYIEDLKKIPHVSVFDYSGFIVTPSK